MIGPAILAAYTGFRSCRKEIYVPKAQTHTHTIMKFRQDLQ